MKKFISIIMAICVLASLATLAVSATDAAAPTTGYTDAPDWVITEINPDQVGDGTGGWSDGKDVFEFFELYNNSGRTLNLYDYAMIYNGNGRTNEKFETVIVEYTPFNGPDWRDGSYTAEQWTDTANAWAGAENLPMNPDTCEVAPGEVVVIWSMYNETQYASWNDGKGMNIEDFRTYWQIPENVKVICWDGNSTVAKAGNDKNFNLKNSDTGTYGIVQKSDVINQAANIEGSTYPISFTECPEMVFWATLSMNDIGGHISNGNLSYNFCIDAQGLGASEYMSTFDSRRALHTETHADATPGTLTTIQKMLLGVELAAGDTLEIANVYQPYAPEEGDFLGLEINGTLYGENDTFTAPSAGVYTVSLKYGVEETEADTTTVAPDGDDTTVAPGGDDDVTTPEDTTTAAPDGDDTTTAAPTTTPAGTTAGDNNGGGCGGFVALGVVACMIPAAVVICKKKHC